MNLGDLHQIGAQLDRAIAQFQAPEWLLASVLPLAMLLLYIRHRRRRPQMTIDDPVVAGNTVGQHQFSDLGRHLSALSFVIVCLMLVLPAAAPIVTSQTPKDQSLIVWLYDGSDSMNEVDVQTADGRVISRYDGAVEAVVASLDSAPKGVYKLAIGFAGDELGHIIDVAQPTKSNTELTAAIRQLKRGVKTPTDVGLAAAIQACKNWLDWNQADSTRSDRLNQVSDYDCTIFVLSDGACDSSLCFSKIQRMAQRAVEEGMTIHAVSWGNHNNPNSRHRPSPTTMRSLAVAGNGAFVDTVQVEALTGLYRDVMKTIPAVENVVTTWPEEAILGSRIGLGVLLAMMYQACIRNPGFTVKVRLED